MIFVDKNYFAIALVWKFYVYCIALCLTALSYCCLLLSPVCMIHLLICTCLNSSPIACLPSSVLWEWLLRILFNIYVSVIYVAVVIYLLPFLDLENTWFVLLCVMMLMIPMIIPIHPVPIANVWLRWLPVFDLVCAFFEVTQDDMHT